jgi:hypothetical protein
MGHANARLTFHGRCLPVRRVQMEGRLVAHVAVELGVSRQCAHRRVRRFDEQGWADLQTRGRQCRPGSRAQVPLARASLPRCLSASAETPGAEAMQHDHVQCVPRCRLPLPFAQVTACSSEVCKTIS